MGQGEILEQRTYELLPQCISGKRLDFLCEKLQELKQHHLPTYFHSLRVGHGAYHMARAQSEQIRKFAFTSGLAHDLGKCHVPVELLSKEGKLTTDERAICRMHTFWGYVMLHDVLPREAYVSARHHFYREYGVPEPEAIPQGAPSEVCKMMMKANKIVAYTDFIDSAQRTDQSAVARTQEQVVMLFAEDFKIPSVAASHIVDQQYSCKELR